MQTAPSELYVRALCLVKMPVDQADVASVVRAYFKSTVPGIHDAALCGRQGLLVPSLIINDVVAVQ